ncbi:MAG: SPOR domain-containing protein [Flavobacteriales bacterium]|nr:SPOR domain-containing protein [Flavobacteriales bacterium]
MLIDKYIENALYLYQCVIVPGFGGFLALEKEASTDPETGKVTPAARVFTFNASLKVNDGVLASYIANMRDISYSESLIEISRGVDYYLSRLSKGDAVDIAGVGMIKPTESGEWIFTSYGEKSFSRENYGLDTWIITVEQSADEDIPQEAAHSSEAECTILPDDKKDETASETKEELSIDELSQVDKTEETQPDISWEKFKSEEQASTGRTGRMVWYILVAALALVLVSLFAFSDDIKDYFKVDSPQVENKVVAPAVVVKDTVAVVDSVKKDSVAVETPAKAILEDVADWNARFIPKNRYYVVHISLTVEENARRELDRLRKEGYPAVFAGKQNGLYMVAYGACDSREEMMEMYDSIRTRHNGEVWVKVYNQVPKK